jgi:serine phosphatase RsbU (regulator of sigma subunit)
MESAFTESTECALVRVYASVHPAEFSQALEILLERYFRNPRFTLLTPSEDGALFWVEHSTCAAVPADGPIPLRSAELTFVHRERLLDACYDGPIPLLTIHAEVLPLRRVRTVTFGGEVIGMIIFHDPLPSVDESPPGEIDLEAALGHALNALEGIYVRTVQAERLECGESKLQGIKEIGQFLGNLDLNTLLSHLISVYVRLTDAQVGSIVLDDGLGGGAEWGLPLEVLDQVRERGGEPLARRSARRGETLLIQDYSDDSRYQPIERFHVDSFLCVPLASKHRILGTVNLIKGGGGRGARFSETDLATVVTISALAAVAIENALLHRDQLEKERIKANLQIARSIQQGMLPAAGLEIPGYDVAFMAKTCDETGGDYFDSVRLAEDRAAFVIGDVAGHGIGAALLMAAGRANLRALLTVKSDLPEVMARLNDLLAADLDSERFMTLCIAELDFRAHVLTTVNAGHDLPLLYRASDSKVEALESTGLPLGMFEGSTYERGIERRLEVGDALLLTTDGVWECTNAQGERFGKPRLAEMLQRSAGKSARDTVNAILAEVESYTRGIARQDDLTLIVVRRCS